MWTCEHVDIGLDQVSCLERLLAIHEVERSWDGGLDFYRKDFTCVFLG
jgi:hypothetical protein